MASARRRNSCAGLDGLGLVLAVYDKLVQPRQLAEELADTEGSWQAVEVVGADLLPC